MDESTENSLPIDRDSTGKFLPGHSIKSPGSPVARHAKELRERLDAALHAEIGDGALKNVIQTMLKLAIGGDVQAAKLLFSTIRPADAALNDELQTIYITLSRLKEQQ